MTVTVFNHHTGTTTTGGVARIGDVLRDSVPLIYTRDADLATIQTIEARMAAGEDLSSLASDLGVTITLS